MDHTVTSRPIISSVPEVWRRLTSGRLGVWPFRPDMDADSVDKKRPGLIKVDFDGDWSGLACLEVWATKRLMRYVDILVQVDEHGRVRKAT